MRFVGTKSRLCSQSDKRNGKTMKKYSFFPFNLFGTCYRSSQKKGRSSQKKGRRQKERREMDEGEKKKETKKKEEDEKKRER